MSKHMKEEFFRTFLYGIPPHTRDDEALYVCPRCSTG